VVEKDDGTRDYINIDPLPDNGGMVLEEIVADGLSRLTKTGRTIAGRIVLCGAAGHVEVLDEIH
jgi:hypothetical protein